ncbi:MAG TPA: hypothetical protein VFQ22_06560 [Longimicrobiales bacterium]|nr:hypothetical protein [Longimicrobiales bacterium]
MSTRARDPRLSEQRESLWILAASPLVWAAHFLLSYGTAAVWCAKAGSPDAPLGAVRGLIFALTAAALVAIALFGWMGWRRHRLGGAAAAPHDDDTPEDRHRFLGLATFLLSGLSAVAVLYAGMVPLFVERCT